jgi:DNA-binding SARP family transcriptional activator/nucleoid-associated protein YgaU
LRRLARWLVAWLSLTLGPVGSLAGLSGVASPAAPTLAAMMPAATAAPMEVSPPAPPAPAESHTIGASEWVHTERVTVSEPSDAWNLAERFLGDGLRWKELWEHNRERLQSDGQRWTDPESTVQAGWELVVPAVTPGRAARAADATGSPGEVTVQDDEHFWVLAERHLATAWGRHPSPAEITPYWQQMIEANRNRLADPRNPDVVYAGQVLVTPPVPVDPTGARTDAAAPGPRGEAPPRAVQVTVDRGDDMWSIAEEHLANRLHRTPTEAEVASYRHVVELNRNRIRSGDPDVIHPGETLLLPEPAAETSETREAPSDEPAGESTAERPAAPDGAPASEPGAPPEPEATAPTEPDAPATTGPPPRPPSTATPTDGTAPRSTEEAEAGGRRGDVSFPLAEVGIGATASVALAVGVIEALRRRRRRRSHRAPTTLPGTGGDEDLLGHLVIDADEDAVRGLCRALGDLAARLAAAGQSCAPRVVQHGPDHLDVLWDRASLPPPVGWVAQADGAIWSLESPQGIPGATDADQPELATPLLVTLGCPDEGGQLYLDLETAGVVALTGDIEVARQVAATLLVEVAHSPFAPRAQVVAVGDLGADRIGELERVRVVDDWAEVAADLEAWATQSRQALAANGWPNPFVGRGHDLDHDALSPFVVVAAEPPPDIEALGMGSQAPTSAAVVMVGEPTAAATVIECHRDRLVLPQLGLTCRPQLLEPASIDGIAEIMNVAEETSGGQLAFSSMWPGATASPSGNGDDYRDPSYEILVRLLGEISVEGGRQRLIAMQTALVAYIALHRSVSADRVIDAVWAGEPSKNPRRRLSHAVDKCRAALGRWHLPPAQHNHYSVGTAVATDVDLFERRVVAAETMPPAQAAEVLRGALELVRDAIFHYPGSKPEANWFSWVSADDWISTWELKIAATARRATELFVELGDAAQAVEAGERAWRTARWDSGLTEALMRAHDANGDRLAACRVYRTHAETLEDLDVESVAASTAELYDKLRSD